MGESRRVALAKRYLRAVWSGNFAVCDALMAPAVVFTDSAGYQLEGFAECSAAARTFHKLEPDCRVDIREGFERGEAVMLRVDLDAADPRISGAYLISVTIRDGLVEEWQIFRERRLAFSRVLRQMAETGS